MGVNLNIWSLTAIIFVGMIIGYLFGVTGRGKETEENETIHNVKNNVFGSGKPLGWAIGSPVAGTVSLFPEGARRGILICPEQGKLFAPVSGKIIRLYPTGNAMRLRTEQGIELLLKAGTRTEELEGMYYRSRVVENEIVGKGKLLLEYDVDKIRQEGYDPDVVVTVEDAENYRDIVLTEEKRVKTGEDLLWVRR